ncbi:hypothetical protein K3553_04375 [Leisingera aquaemixtae]|uniref:hypothetical protein n=1 Tax=Leisingera aquaemixtae TaxID=1396826 RepID=UPI0021A2A7DE|nr:hypothetical protein [Leisingera aquaemixtae]UWQ25704.1 hypothetical protein K3553_04375 [Leisingera aquaemixtae]
MSKQALAWNAPDENLLSPEGPLQVLTGTASAALPQFRSPPCLHEYRERPFAIFQFKLSLAAVQLPQIHLSADNYRSSLYLAAGRPE